MGSHNWQPVVAALLALPLPFACGGSTADVAAADDAGDERTSPPHDAAQADVVGRDTAAPDTGPLGPGAHPPAPPSAPATTSVLEHNFAVQTLYLGDTPRGSAMQSTTAWKKFGYDIDGKISTRSSTDVCTLVAGAPKSVHENGDVGIDNSWGANLLPIFSSTVGSSFSSNVNQSIRNGNATLLFDTVGLSDDAAQTNTGLSGQLFGGGAFAGAPTFTIADNWPVTAESLQNGSTIAGGAKTRFATAYVVGGTWVSGSTSDVTVRIALNGVELALVIHHAVVTFDHSAAAKATNGTIAGVLDTEEFVAMFRSVAGRFSASLCSGSALESLSSQFRQASDILNDGTNVAGVACNGISIGLGFEADQIAPPTSVSPPSPPPPDPCGG